MTGIISCICCPLCSRNALRRGGVPAVVLRPPAGGRGIDMLSSSLAPSHDVETSLRGAMVFYQSTIPYGTSPLLG